MSYSLMDLRTIMAAWNVYISVVAASACLLFLFNSDLSYTCRAASDGYAVAELALRFGLQP